ncbi:hypothetical protein NDI45_10865 [Leptolyngbya sp. GB1-A1]|uniref:hypothetical protein n=1 Tax=Leptolyngbya sp. GB1-A1 TaxID=2933908 RepID=UPI003297A141
MSVPIVFIHKSNSYYLLVSLDQARRTNPDSEIHLIGDASNDRYSFVHHHKISDYLQEAQQFSEIYQHFNTNPYEFELFCFQRWFILNEFLKLNNIKSCFYVDSDVMLYTNISLEKQRFERFDITLSYPPCFDSPSPHCMFINQSETLDDFCKFTKNIYLDEALMKIMKFQFEKCNGYGGACDMTAFREYWFSERSSIGNTAITLDNSIYDHNINEPNGFETQYGIKKIYWISGVPFCQCVESGEKIQIKLLHFQGIAKPLMKNYCSHKTTVIKYYMKQLRSKIAYSAKKYVKPSKIFAL